MGGPVAAAEDAVAELRLRLYRRDPPPGAVAAYLAAVAALPEVAAPRVPAPRRAAGRRRPGRAAAVLLGALLLGATAVAAVAGAGREAAAVDRAARPVATSAVPVPSAVGIPIGVLSGTRDGAARFVANGSRVVVSISCTGTGTIAMRIADEDPVVLTCGNGGPALALIGSTGRLDRFAVTVRPDPAMPWALAVGALP